MTKPIDDEEVLHTRQLDANELITRQEAELALLARDHTAELDELRRRHERAAAEVVLRHTAELRELWRRQGREIGPGLERAGGTRGA